MENCCLRCGKKLPFAYFMSTLRPWEGPECGRIRKELGAEEVRRQIFAAEDIAQGDCVTCPECGEVKVRPTGTTDGYGFCGNYVGDDLWVCGASGRKFLQFDLWVIFTTTFGRDVVFQEIDRQVKF